MFPNPRVNRNSSPFSHPHDEVKRFSGALQDAALEIATTQQDNIHLSPIGQRNGDEFGPVKIVSFVG
jgi:hypothetical protein